MERNWEPGLRSPSRRGCSGPRRPPQCIPRYAPVTRTCVTVRSRALSEVDVLGKSAEEVAEALLGELGPEFKSGVIVLVGLSGTGKGTTVDMLKGRLPRATTWSNGNIFRALTLLAVTHCLQQGLEFNQAALTPTNLALWMGMLSFEHRKADGVVVSAPSCQEGSGFFDTRICGLGLDLWVSDVCNTVLKGPMVGKNIPTVAELTQGEVVAFASNACQAMGDAGICVLLEGREQTVPLSL